MKILISGGTGLVGKELTKQLRENGHIVRILTRKKSTEKDEFYWNVTQKEIDEKAFDGIECIIHLSGANIGEKWTEKYKKIIYDSRINTANFLFEKCKELNVNLKSFISAGGINYYGTFTSDEIISENSAVLHNDFLSDICVKWEQMAWRFSDIAERIVILRMAPVLSAKGGFYQQIKRIADLNLSSGLGNGNQWFNWIHIADLVNMFKYGVENQKINGAINATTTEIPTNQYFMKEVAKSRGKLFIPINVPSILLKLMLGEMSEILLNGTRVSNDKIKSLGFEFQYNSLRKALDNVNRY